MFFCAFDLVTIIRSVLKVNEFTLAGAMRRALFQEPLSGQKKRRGALLLLARKRDIFKKEYNSPQWRSTRHHPGRIQYAQDTIHPWLSTGGCELLSYSLCS